MPPRKRGNSKTPAKEKESDKPKVLETKQAQRKRSVAVPKEITKVTKKVSDLSIEVTSRAKSNKKRTFSQITTKEDEDVRPKEGMKKIIKRNGGKSETKQV